MKNLKGQAAMEYLMTYGWAILAIVIVIAVLIFLKPFGFPEMCRFEQVGFTCNEPPPQLYVDGQGNLWMNAKVWNQIGQPIIVKRMVCTSVAGAEIPAAVEDKASEYTGKRVQTGSFLQIGGGGDVERLPCYDAQGNQITSQPNQDFRGQLVIWFNYEGDIDPNVQHQIKASITSRITQAS